MFKTFETCCSKQKPLGPIPNLQSLFSSEKVSINIIIKVSALNLRKATLHPIGEPFLNFKVTLEVLVLVIEHLLWVIISKAAKAIINSCESKLLS